MKSCNPYTLWVEFPAETQLREVFEGTAYFGMGEGGEGVPMLLRGEEEGGDGSEQVLIREDKKKLFT